MGPPGLVWSNESLNGLYEREDVEMERWKEKQTDGTQRIKIEIKYKIKVVKWAKRTPVHLNINNEDWKCLNVQS